MDYSLFYKNKFENVELFRIASNDKYDLFISTYNESDRVKRVFDSINADEKHWLILPEYKFENVEIVDIQGEVYNYSDSTLQEDEIILDYFERHENIINNDSRIAIDITGMLRPYIVFLVRLLHKKGFHKMDFIYSEPRNYKQKEETIFSEEYIEVREIKGCLGSHNPETSNDVLFLGSGYDYNRMISIAKEKKEAKKIQMIGFPSLQADMFQQNILRSYKAEEDASSGEFELDSQNIILAPANDPFITASLLSEFIKNAEREIPFTNIYICPLSTKAQTLGMVLYFIYECIEKPASMIFPFCEKYSRETSEGISRIWRYTLEFPRSQ